MVESRKKKQENTHALAACALSVSRHVTQSGLFLDSTNRNALRFNTLTLNRQKPHISFC